MNLIREREREKETTSYQRKKKEFNPSTKTSSQKKKRTNVKKKIIKIKNFRSMMPYDLYMASTSALVKNFCLLRKLKLLKMTFFFMVSLSSLSVAFCCFFFVPVFLSLLKNISPPVYLFESLVANCTKKKIKRQIKICGVFFVFVFLLFPIKKKKRNPQIFLTQKKNKSNIFKFI